ncbi:hypothetical protein EV714DRAFT_170365, partial [Schizophyllum commune]
GRGYRVIQTAFDHFGMSLAKTKDDPSSALLRRIRLLTALLDDVAIHDACKVRNLPLRVEHSLSLPLAFEGEPSFDTISPRAHRKHPCVEDGLLSKLADATNEADAEPEKGSSAASVEVLEPQTHADFPMAINGKGISCRIYSELYKVTESLDITLYVLGIGD